MITDDEPNIASEYEYDIDAIDPFLPNQQMSSTLSQNIDIIGSLSADDSITQDVNNNNENENEICENKINIKKGEYSYHAFGNVKNYWAGPSYWKVPRNRSTIQSDKETIKSKSRKRRRIIDIPIKFIDTPDDESSDEELFIKATSRAAKKLRYCKYNRWDADKLKLPPQTHIPKDLFHTYTFAPSIDIFHSRQSIDTISDLNEEENNVENDFPVSILSDELTNILIRVVIRVIFLPLINSKWILEMMISIHHKLQTNLQSIRNRRH